MTSIDEAIQKAREVSAATPEGHPDRAGLYNNLSICLSKRYSTARALTDLEEAIHTARKAVDATTVGQSDRASFLSNLGNRLSTRFSETGSMTDLEEAIQAGQQAVDMTPKDHDSRLTRLINLETNLHARYSKTRAVADLDQLLTVTRQVSDATPMDHSDYTKNLKDLWNCLGARYLRAGSTRDLDEAIQVARRIADVTSEVRAHAGWLNDISNLLEDRYTKTGDMKDLEGSVHIARQALSMVPEDHPDRAGFLSNLGIRLRNSYARTGVIADHVESMAVSQQAVNITAEDDPRRAQWILQLANCLSIRSARTGSIADIDEAIDITQQALDQIPEDHPQRAGRLSNLGHHLGTRYARTGIIGDLDQAIKVTQQAVDAGDHPNSTSFLDNLGGYLSVRYRRTGAIADLDRAIHISRQAVMDANPEGCSNLVKWLEHLGSHLFKRFSSIGALADLEEAIQVTRKAVHVTAHDHPDYTQRLDKLGTFLHNRYLRTGVIADLDQAIHITQEAVDQIPKNFPESDRAGRLSNLARHLSARYSRTGIIDDIDQAIEAAQQAVRTVPKDHPDRANFLNNLGGHLAVRYARTRVMSDLDQAVHTTQEAIDTCPKDHQSQAGFLSNIGKQLATRHYDTEAKADSERALTCLESALTTDNAPIEERISAGIALLQLCASVSDWTQGFNYSATAVELVPKLNARSLHNADKQHRLSQIVGLACDACAAALNAGKTPLVALTLLEQGRGVLAASLNDLQTDILDLQAVHPKLAKRFLDLRKELQPPAVEHLPHAGPDHVSSYDTPTDRRHLAGIELDGLVAEVQRLPDFEGFLQPPSEREILEAGKHGPVVVINASQYRCDAILVDRERISSVRLPRLTHQEINEKLQQRSLKSPHILGWLWDVVVLPVLDALGHTEPPPHDEWPHVWWIPTGPLSKFPLHAAGYHARDSTRTALDRVMSSYSSSIKAIIHVRRRCSILQVDPKGPDQALLVALQNTPGQAPLHFAAREARVLYDLCGSSDLHPVQPGKRKKDVISHLPNCKIFHFAGHGHTDDDDPSQSSLLLEDWESDPLTVANLLDLNLRERAPFLAYLSACGTGETRDERLFDESIHLVSACQLAGFRHVIGTLWEVNDASCVEIARATYEEIFHGGMTDESVCLGLHEATRKLRDFCFQDLREFRHEEKLAGMVDSITIHGSKSPSRDGDDSRLPRKVTLDDSDDENLPLHWVPYVHFGV